jgi:hypothetical protein
MHAGNWMGLPSCSIQAVERPLPHFTSLWPCFSTWNFAKHLPTWGVHTGVSHSTLFSESPSFSLGAGVTSCSLVLCVTETISFLSFPLLCEKRTSTPGPCKLLGDAPPQWQGSTVVRLWLQPGCKSRLHRFYMEDLKEVS